jgi:cytochrome c55X
VDFRAARLSASLLLSWLATAAHASPPDDAQQGRELYTSYCARCHGVNLVNTGAATDLRKFPKDQQERFERSVQQGLRAMPAWGSILQPAEVRAIWSYVVSNQP